MKKYWIGIIILIILAAIPVAAYPDEWTFMVYLDGDNNLESAAIDDFLEMAEVGSDVNVNIIVQIDRVSFEVLDAIGQGAYDDTRYGNWTTTKRFKVLLNSTPTTTDPGYISDIGELNMGDPDTLKDFVNWAIADYPATRYALILWNHGGGWRSRMRAMGLDREAIKAVCWDETDNADCLYMWEVRSALLNITKHMHLIGFDACLMGMIEVAHQIYSSGSVMVGSEEVEPVCGWPYDDILTALVATPSMDASALGTQIVNKYMAHTTTKDYTQSAIDLSTSTISALTSAVDSFAQALGYDSDIATARANVEYYYDPAHIDLYHFAYLCKLYSSNSTIDSRAQTVMDNVTNAVITNGHSSTDYPNSHGIAIYFPKYEEDYDSNYGSSIVNTFSTTHWDEFLHNYYNQVPPGGAGDKGTTGTGGSSGGKVCFIATAAYSGKGIGESEMRRSGDSHRFPVSPFPRFTASPDHPINVLKRFRDEYLLTNAPGRAFVSCYERISPPIARYIENKESLKTMVRFYLKPIVWLTKKVTSNPSVTETLNK